MFTVAIAGVLAAIALPAFSYYLFKAKRTEAVIGLHHVWDLQRAYEVNHNGEYATDFDALGFSPGYRIDSHTAHGKRYTYQISQPYGEGTWYCSASAELDGDEWPDVLVTGVFPASTPSE